MLSQFECQSHYFLVCLRLNQTLSITTCQALINLYTSASVKLKKNAYVIELYQINERIDMCIPIKINTFVNKKRCDRLNYYIYKYIKSSLSLQSEYFILYMKPIYGVYNREKTIFSLFFVLLVQEKNSDQVRFMCSNSLLFARIHLIV